VCATWQVVLPDAALGASVPIGHALQHVSVHVLDAALRPVPDGVVGEICIGGAGLARGYLGREDLTAERFIVHPGLPDGTLAGQRLYRSGDLGRWLASGELDHVGRVDDQIKLRGHRVELGEIEAQLCLHPSVREAVVQPRPGAQGQTRLVAYVTPATADEIDVVVLREHLKAQLPEHMVPAAVVVLPSLPLSPNGKVDKKALPAPQDDALARAAHQAPQGHVEEVLAQIMGEVLGVKQVGRLDHFFDLGGHSLLAVQLSTRVKQALGVELPLRALFEAPVLADLAQRLMAHGQQSVHEHAIERVLHGGQPLPLSWPQQRLWFIDQMQGGSKAYQIPLALRLRGALNVKALQDALDAIVARHEALRTRFITVQGQGRQVVDAEGRFDLTMVDLTLVDASVQADA